jgi:ribosome-associated protein
MHDIEVTGPISLGAFIKLSGAVGTGGEAKLLIQNGDVTVNGVVERRRGCRLSEGDVVKLGGHEYRVCSSPV